MVKIGKQYRKSQVCLEKVINRHASLTRHTIGSAPEGTEEYSMKSICNAAAALSASMNARTKYTERQLRGHDYSVMSGELTKEWRNEARRLALEPGEKRKRRELLRAALQACDRLDPHELSKVSGRLAKWLALRPEDAGVTDLRDLVESQQELVKLRQQTQS